MKRQVRPVLSLKIVLICFCFGLLNLGIAVWFSWSSFSRSSPPHQLKEAEVYPIAVDTMEERLRAFQPHQPHQTYSFRLQPKEVGAVTRGTDESGKPRYLIKGHLLVDKDTPPRRFLTFFGLPPSEPPLYVRWYVRLWQEPDGTWGRPAVTVGKASLP